MGESTSVSVRMLGCLHSLRQERGLPTVVEVSVPEGGLTAQAIAEGLELPLDRIEAVFCNHITYSLDHVIHPGDAIAFVPQGIPGPHRFTLGIHEAGKGSKG